MAMKKRWIGGLALVAALSLGACAPTQQGAEESEEPAPAVETAAPATEPSETPEAMESESAEPTPDDYEY
jgi:hypothetical protein